MGLGIGQPYEVFAMPVKPGRGNPCDLAGKEAKVVISPKLLKMNLQQSFDARIYP
jgi:hypothetical protein